MRLKISAAPLTAMRAAVVAAATDPDTHFSLPTDRSEAFVLCQVDGHEPEVIGDTVRLPPNALYSAVVYRELSTALDEGSVRKGLATHYLGSTYQMGTPVLILDWAVDFDEATERNGLYFYDAWRYSQKPFCVDPIDKECATPVGKLLEAFPVEANCPTLYPFLCFRKELSAYGSERFSFPKIAEAFADAFQAADRFLRDFGRLTTCAWSRSHYTENPGAVTALVSDMVLPVAA